MTSRTLWLTLIVLCLGSVSQASTARSGAAQEPARLSVGDPLARAGLLRPGVRRYLRYSVRDGAHQTIDLWTRVVSFEESDQGPVLRIRQQWDRVVEPASTRMQDSTFEAGSFRPLTHRNEVRTRDGITVSAYRFEGVSVVGDDTVAENSRAAFREMADEAAFNFETDIEQFQTLPWGPGYEVNIPFYDPGLAPPDRYTFKTARSEVLRIAGSEAIDCWVVTADYNTGSIRKTFWISKRDQLVVREEAEGDGVLYVKMLISQDSLDPA